MISIRAQRGILIDFIEMHPKGVSIEGVVCVPTEDDDAETWLGDLALRRATAGEADGIYPAVFRSPFRQRVCFRKDSKYKSEAVCRRFSCTIPLTEGKGHLVSWYRPSTGDSPLNWAQVFHGEYSPLTEKLSTSYGFTGNWLIRRTRHGDLSISPAKIHRRLLFETLFCLQVFSRFSVPSWRALAFRFIVTLFARFKRRPIWLFADRVNKADDNGRAMFEFACRQKEIPGNPVLVFAVDKSTGDYHQLAEIGRVVNIRSLWYKVLFASCDFLISAYRTKAQRMPFANSSISYSKNVILRNKFIYLRHGVSMNDLAESVGRAQINARIIVSTAPRERASILQGDYGYTERESKLCGLPRFDKLCNRAKKIISFMPTWRSYLVTRVGSYEHVPLEGFAESAYCRAYRALFSDQRLKEACERLGYRMQLMIHPNMVKTLPMLEVGPHITVLPTRTSYRDIFAESALLVTDYSSVVFDFGYLKKPLVHFQFDKEEFFGDQYGSGYFSYENDGFGEVETTVEATVSRIIEYLENGCRMKPEYRERVERFFAFTDGNNCQRVYDAILEAARDDDAGTNGGLPADRPVPERRTKGAPPAPHGVRVSIIMPIYNAERYLRESLDSILGQSMPDIEVFCIDDGSTDGSRRILEELAASDPRVKILDTPHVGAYRARKEGVGQAIGEYIYFMDADDMIAPNAFEELCALADKEDLDQVIFSAKVFADANDKERLVRNYLEKFVRRYELPPRVCGKIASGAEVFELLHQYKCYFPSMPLRLIRARILKDNELKFPNASHHGDNYFTMASLFCSKRVCVIPTKYYNRRIRTGSMTTSVGKERIHFISIFNVMLELCRFEPFAKRLLAGGVAESQYMKKLAGNLSRWSSRLTPAERLEAFRQIGTDCDSRFRQFLEICFLPAIAKRKRHRSLLKRISRRLRRTWHKNFRM